MRLLNAKVLDSTHLELAEPLSGTQGERIKLYTSDAEAGEEAPPQPLTNLQLELLKLFSADLEPKDLVELKRELGRFFANRAIRGAGKIWKERQLTDEDMEAWLHG